MGINEKISYEMSTIYLNAPHWYLAFGIQGGSLIFTYLVKLHCGNGIERICSTIAVLLKKHSRMVEKEETIMKPVSDINN